MSNKPMKTFSFLMEFIMVLFFFCISSLICVEIYTTSILKNKEANLKKEALEYAQNYIESNKYDESSFDIVLNDEDIHVSIIQDEYRSKIILEKDGKELVSLPFFMEDAS